MTARVPWAESYEIDANGCFIWKRSRQSRGYGKVWFDGKERLAHRVAWLRAHGRWPAEGKVIDHVCNVKACVNPDHLRELDNWQNLRRARPFDPLREPQRERWRSASQRHRGSYSATYRAERGETHNLV